MECVAYVRVSTEKQAEEGLGLESQKRDIENYARKNELIISDWYVDDGYTGANMNRPQLQRLITDCSRKRVQCVVAFKLDRLSRSMVDGVYLIERIFQANNVEFRCVHDNVGYDDPMQQAYTQMMAVFAQLDKNTMLLRMRGGMLERVKQGYWWGGGNLPYCYSYNKATGILEPIPERAEQARDALDLFLRGYSDKRIWRMLGYKAEHTVHDILTGVVNIGMIPFKGEIYQGRHEPIFDKASFERGLEMRKIRRQARAYTRTEVNMLTGLCYCGVCGCKMHYQIQRSKGVHKLYCYSRDAYARHLPNWNPNCNNSAVWAEDVEKAVESQILSISLNLSSSPQQESQKKSAIVERSIEQEKARVKRLYEIYSEGNDTVIEIIKEKEEHIRSLKAQLEKEYALENRAPSKNLVYEKIKTLADVWDALSKQEENGILKIIIEKIVIVNGKVDIYLRDF